MKRNLFTLILILCGISSNAQAKLALTDPSWNFYHKNGATIYSALMQIRDNEWYEKNIQQILNDNDLIKRRNLLNNSILEVYFDGSVKAIYNPNLPNEIKNAFIDLAKYIEDNHCIIYRYWHSGNIENNIFSDSTIKSKAEILELLIKYINKNIDSSDFTIDELSDNKCKFISINIFNDVALIPIHDKRNKTPYEILTESSKIVFSQPIKSSINFGITNKDLDIIVETAIKQNLKNLPSQKIKTFL